MATNKQAAARIEREARAKARAEIKAADASYAAARRALRDHLRTSAKERREEARRVASDVRAIKSRYRSSPRELGQRLAERRASYRDWWRGVLLERSRRRDDIQRLKELLANLRRTAPAAIRHAVRQRLIEAEKSAAIALAKSDASAARLSSEVRRSKRAATGTRGGHRLGSGIFAPKPRRTKAAAARSVAERRAEFADSVAANLSPSSAAWYRRHARMFPGESSGVPPDSVAERVVEALEAEPEELVEDEQARADDWLRAQLVEAGFL